MREQNTYAIRWHGRGGQGAVTSAKVLADAAFRSGFAGVMSQPSFGAERRGAPVTASTRLAREPIRDLSQVTEPDIVIVLDESLVALGGPTAGLRPGGLVIVNSPGSASDLGIEDATVVTSDVTGAAEAADLIVGGQPMVSTAILGAVAAATGLVTMHAVEQAIEHAFTGSAARKNIEAARIAFECTVKGA
jgi:2-oxoacid:acceptor oxidoreductase gamma subunit (pyruvate/2-ketoisovalerate family)